MRTTYAQRARRRRNTTVVYGIMLVFGFVLLAVIGGFVMAGNEQTKTCTVSEKDRAKNSEGASDMRVYTEECGTLAVGDVWLKGQFDSADTFGTIDVGKTYEFTTVGYRIPIASRFPTIIEVK